MTTYDIKFTDNNIKNTNNGNIYSQILDDIILSTVKKNNSYLFNTKKGIMKGIKLGKIYRLENGLPVIFYNDEIQIGTDIYSYSDFSDYNFISSLSPEIKKTIININIKL